MTNEVPYRIKSIAEYHGLRGYTKPEHPLISLVRIEEAKYMIDKSLVLDFYSISNKRGLSGKLKYGQQEYGFNDGAMFFIAPNQVFKVEHNSTDETTDQPTGWMLLIHPDFLSNTSLSKNIKQYEFFGYTVKEALWLLEKEEKIIDNIIQNILQEYYSNIDKFSKQIIISQIESLLTYADRFYNRQFITTEKANHVMLERLEKLLNNYFKDDNLITKGLPTVQYIAQELNISPNYLSSSLRVLTGQNTQQHIHDKLIEIAKEKLANTNSSISEIAYELGFEHLQSFSKLFKAKTAVSPLEFRHSFN